MATVFALQHLTSKRYLTVSPVAAPVGAILGEHPDAEKAHGYERHADAEIAHLALEEWAPAYRIVPVARDVPETVPDVG